MEWVVHATIIAEGLKEEDLPRIFGPREDFSYMELGRGVVGGVEVSSPGALEIFTSRASPADVMAVLMEICERLNAEGFKVGKLSIEAIPLG